MSGFQNRSDAGVYGLNMDPSTEYDMSLQQQSPIAFDDSDLSLFANADLVNFDWDEGMPSNQFKQDPQANFHFPAEQFQSQPETLQFGISPTAPTFQTTPHFQGISPNPTSLQKENDQSPASSTPHASQAGPAPKRVRDDSADSSEPPPHDDVARRAADEDKRRRNTAASARFRVKKKQREQQMEQTARDMSDKVKLLEQKILKLEDENTFLRGLITEKEGKKVDIDELRKSKQKEEKKAAEVKAESA